MPDGRYYIIVGHKQRRYFRSLDQARAAYLADQMRALSSANRAELTAKAEVRRAAALERLERAGILDLVDEPIIPAGPLVLHHDDLDIGFFQYLESANKLADLAGVPQVQVRHTDKRTTPSHAPTLSRVLAEWRRLKSATHKGRETEHMRDVARAFKRFIKVVGDVPLDELSAAHFRLWREWVLDESVKRASGKWSNDQHAMVKQVLRFVRRHQSDWPWPDGLSDWVDAYERHAYQPKADNKQPLPVDEFNRLLETAHRWSHADTEAFDRNSQRGRGQRRQAFVKRELGLQLVAILRLAANCGLDPVDIERLRPEHLRLDAEVPHLDLPRLKVAHRVGAAVDRKTPLLPSTVAALTAALKGRAGIGPVFRSSRGAPLKRLSQLFRRLADDACTERKWSFKRLRNIGSTLAKRAKLSTDERQAFLGHAIGGTSKFHEGDLDERYLTDLVNLIGNTYFGGESVTVAQPIGQSVV